jgi:aminodeoxyfutalosine deaminase
MHIAETGDELELLASRTGSLRTMLERRGVWHDDAWPAVVSIADYLQILATAPRALVVHGNYLTTRDMEIISEHRDRMSVIYCPRTHAYFEHSPHAYPEMIKRGINVALGTDSRASNPDLSVFEEMRAVAEQGRIAPSEILKMGTINGSRALGLGDEFGSFKVGVGASLCKVDGLDKHMVRDPYEALFSEVSQCTPLQ